jgi:hypothetical protein
MDGHPRVFLDDGGELFGEGLGGFLGELCGFVEEPLAGKERGGYRAAADCYGGYFQVPMTEGDDKPDGGPHEGRTGWVGVVPFNRLHGFKENLSILKIIMLTYTPFLQNLDLLTSLENF